MLQDELDVDAPRLVGYCCSKMSWILMLQDELDIDAPR